MKIDEYKKLVGARNKLNAQKITVDGITFDSKKEAARFGELSILEKRGEIRDLQRQVKFELIPTQREEPTDFYKAGAKKGQPKPGRVLEKGVSYVADFTYYDRDGRFIVEDVKGYRDPRNAQYAKFVLKRKLMLWIFGIVVKEV